MNEEEEEEEVKRGRKVGEVGEASRHPQQAETFFNPLSLPSPHKLVDKKSGQKETACPESAATSGPVHMKFLQKYSLIPNTLTRKVEGVGKQRESEYHCG